MNVLVAYASKHESTHAIAERIAQTLREQGAQAVVLPVEHVDGLQGYEAFVIGSAVYYGSWMKEAVDFVLRNQSTLVLHPVWLFSSGPTGPRKAEAEVDARQLAAIKQAVKPLEHRTFYGALELDKLSFLERTVVRGVHAPTGDFREWDEIDAWAKSIASDLQPAAAAKS
jgi:menaquinone-dependent protoporphyrinogen oxidase